METKRKICHNPIHFNLTADKKLMSKTVKNAIILARVPCNNE